MSSEFQRTKSLLDNELVKRMPKLIAFGVAPRGIIAIGLVPMGLISIGGVSMGIVTVGIVGMGLINACLVGCGLIVYGVKVMGLIWYELWGRTLFVGNELLVVRIYPHIAGVLNSNLCRK